MYVQNAFITGQVFFLQDGHDVAIKSDGNFVCEVSDTCVGNNRR